MKILYTIILILAVAMSAMAQVPNEPNELTSLREYWKKARVSALAPIDSKYLLAMKVLKTKLTQAGKLQEALAVDAEIANVTVEQQEATDAAKPADMNAGRISPTVITAQGWIYSIPSENYNAAYEFLPNHQIKFNSQPSGIWTIKNGVFRMDINARLWQEFTMDPNGVLREIDSSKGKREATLTARRFEKK